MVEPPAPPTAASPPSRIRIAGADARARRLARNRLLATALLVAMAAIYVATLVAEPATWVLLLRSAAEAGVVGGLADWFAVTALFRRPLGLPIPHTAIIPNNKERIAATLRDFIEQNFLTREVLERKFRDAKLAERFIDWLTAPETARSIADWLSKLAPQLATAFGSSDVLRLVGRATGHALREIDMAPLLHKLIEIVNRSGGADAILDGAISIALDWLRENEQHIQSIVQAKSRWWVPKAVNRRIAQALMEGISEVLVDLSDPQGQRRLALQSDLRGFARRSPEWAEHIRTAKDRVLAHPRLRALIDDAWKELSASLRHELEAPSPQTRAALERAVASSARLLATNPAIASEINALMERMLLAVVVRRRQVAAIVEEVIRRWDPHTMTERLELAVGSDLQYIRMNGTLVGAGVGALIFAASRLLSLH